MSPSSHLSKMLSLFGYQPSIMGWIVLLLMMWLIGMFAFVLASIIRSDLGKDAKGAEAVVVYTNPLWLFFITVLTVLNFVLKATNNQIVLQVFVFLRCVALILDYCHVWIFGLGLLYTLGCGNIGSYLVTVIASPVFFFIYALVMPSPLAPFMHTIP